MTELTQMTPFMVACYYANYQKVLELLHGPLKDRDIYNGLIMCKEGLCHNPFNENYNFIHAAIKERYPDLVKPDSGPYAEFVLLDRRGPTVKYTMYEGGSVSGLV